MHLYGFYLQFVQGFQAVAAPLTAMFKAYFEREWTAVHQAAFDKLKQAMINATNLSAIDPRVQSCMRRFCTNQSTHVSHYCWEESFYVFQTGLDKPSARLERFKRRPLVF